MSATEETATISMQRYFIYLAFDGTRYHGWQRQPFSRSVQEDVEHALTILLGKETGVTGAGRTDAGVHASLMTAHFDTDEPLGDEARDALLFRLRRFLGREVYIYAIVPVKEDAHARFSAQTRTYHYYLATDNHPFLSHYCYILHRELLFDEMNRAAAVLLRHTDFQCFSKVHTDVKTFTCHISQARFSPLSQKTWRFEITADRFLRNMVRAIVGTLLEVGRGREDAESYVLRVLQSRNRSAAGESVPGHALFLSDITYPEELFPDGTAPRIEKKEAFLSL